MTVSAEMISHLASNVTFLVDIWSITARDGTVAAYADHTRDLTYDSVLYKASLVNPSRPVRKIGLEVDSSDMIGIYDSIITEAGIQQGKWKRARIVRQFVNYLDLTMGSVCRQTGYAGKFKPRSGGMYTLEFRSQSSLYHQNIGETTSPTDRNATPDELGVSMGAFTFARTVASVTSNRVFTISGAAQVDSYFKNGRLTWTSGANTDLSMEIKDNVGNLIELQLPMPSNIVASDGVTLIAGYNQTRDQARDKFAGVVNFNGEPDLPGLASILTYPEVT